MTALEAALFTAALALIGKILFDLWNQFEQRRMVASAIAGELAAYMSFYQDGTAADNFRTIANMDPALRAARLRAINPVPTGHPVFDKMSDKIGSLEESDIFGISLIYNVVTGFRLVIMHMSTEAFGQTDAEHQKAVILFAAKAIEDHLPIAQQLIADLRSRSRESFWRYLWGKWRPQK